MNLTPNEFLLKLQTSETKSNHELKDGKKIAISTYFYFDHKNSFFGISISINFHL